MLEEISCIRIVLREILSGFNRVVAQSSDRVENDYGLIGIFVAINEVNKVHVSVRDNLSNNNEQRE